ncbi:MAG: hypothetical protein LBM71_05195 [Elusimicrobiota bacterium]|jgi:hypothetical protein|nr:hypothetical protein [Elusimicrobiota bacterium]
MRQKLKAKIKGYAQIIKSNKGQQAVEFVLMLGVIVTIVLAISVSFHKELAGGFFTLIGSIIPS